jgi:tRNA (cytidine/uridine-2'-O-)-methyltransferase
MPDTPAPKRLRARAPTPAFSVVLVEPEIPPNTGNIARLCGATGCNLHLVGRLGFELSEHRVRRAGLDYWHLVSVEQHASLEQAESRITEGAPHARCYLLSGHAERSYLDVRFQPGDALVFGKESVGLEPALLDARPEDVIGIPMPGEVRSLNLANAVAIVLYEALRQSGVLQPSFLA